MSSCRPAPKLFSAGVKITGPTELKLSAPAPAPKRISDASTQPAVSVATLPGAEPMLMTPAAPGLRPSSTLPRPFVPTETAPELANVSVPLPLAPMTRLPFMTQDAPRPETFAVPTPPVVSPSQPLALRTGVPGGSICNEPDAVSPTTRSLASPQFTTGVTSPVTAAPANACDTGVPQAAVNAAASAKRLARPLPRPRACSLATCHWPVPRFRAMR
ncbi:Uncharacterised protein [Achromobacter xylosoxidans]|nr:hypothetical protein [Achromobacter xylosoxidans]CUI93842.1 Uncharacterised protein [Achromobacter xylosoxidans]